MTKKRIKMRPANPHWHCQREIEMQAKCGTSCSHCRKYYAPLDEPIGRCEASGKLIFEGDDYLLDDDAGYILRKYAV